MYILDGLARLYRSFWPGPSGPLPYLPPEVKARILDQFEGSPKDYLNVMHTDRAWRATALEPVTLSRYLQRRQRPVPVDDPPAQALALANLVVAPRNLRRSCYHIREIPEGTLERARTAALKPAIRHVPAEPGTMRVHYAPNGAWAVSVHDRHTTILKIWDLTRTTLTCVDISLGRLSFPPEGAAISNDGNTVLLHSGQRDLVFRSPGARDGHAYERLTLFDADLFQRRSFANSGGSVRCIMAPSGHWAIIDIGVGKSLHLWDLTGQRPKRTLLTHPEFVPLKSTFFFSADETRLYFKTLTYDETLCANFGL